MSHMLLQKKVHKLLKSRLKCENKSTCCFYILSTTKYTFSAAILLGERFRIRIKIGKQYRFAIYISNMCLPIWDTKTNCMIKCLVLGIGHESSFHSWSNIDILREKNVQANHLRTSQGQILIDHTLAGHCRKIKNENLAT